MSPTPLAMQMCFSRGSIHVTKHFPEQYLVLFSNHHDRQRVLDRTTINNRGRCFSFAPWSEQRHGSVVRWEFRVRLRIEGSPVHAWNEGVAALVIGSQCAIHYVEGKTRRRERTRTYGLWAWCVNPSNIAKEGWHTVTDPDREMDGRRQEVEVHYEEPSGFKFGITYKLFIHLDVVEDLSFIQGPGGDPNRKTRRVFDWQYGVPDSLGERRERPRGRQEDRGTTPRRRDDDDNDDYHRGTRRHRSSHAWERVSRCRGAVEDCYSTSRHLGHRSGGVYPHHSRPSLAGWGSDAWDSGLRRLTNTRKFIYKPKKCSSSKKVSFACPLVQTMGHPTKEARILEMLSEAEGLQGGWQASLVAAQEEPMEAEADVLEEGEIQRGEVALETVEEVPFAARNPLPSNTQVVQQVSEIENKLVNGAIVTTSPEDNEINDLSSFINYISCALLFLYCTHHHVLIICNQMMITQVGCNISAQKHQRHRGKAPG
ncbi:uncharacterized protein LOC120640263 [Panicum virgatum]|uniref:uncharacterized protein LOC120640263 n=1 Tax=Panicum virgatum TaxID=38727 RepID=UPI0019D59500|nr:uncharacterized protein LOC120640263 [Panicum virgatum]